MLRGSDSGQAAAQEQRAGLHRGKDANLGHKHVGGLHWQLPSLYCHAYKYTDVSACSTYFYCHLLSYSLFAIGSTTQSFAMLFILASLWERVPVMTVLLQGSDPAGRYHAIAESSKVSYSPPVHMPLFFPRWLGGGGRAVETFISPCWQTLYTLFCTIHAFLFLSISWIGLTNGSFSFKLRWTLLRYSETASEVLNSLSHWWFSLAP